MIATGIQCWRLRQHGILMAGRIKYAKQNHDSGIEVEWKHAPSSIPTYSLRRAAAEGRCTSRRCSTAQRRNAPGQINASVRLAF